MYIYVNSILNLNSLCPKCVCWCVPGVASCVPTMVTLVCWCASVANPQATYNPIKNIKEEEIEKDEKIIGTKTIIYRHIYVDRYTK